MTLERVEALDAEWYVRGPPPPRVTLAGLAGWKPKPVASDVAYSPEDLAAFLAAYPGGERLPAPEERPPEERPPGEP